MLYAPTVTRTHVFRTTEAELIPRTSLKFIEAEEYAVSLCKTVMDTYGYGGVCSGVTEHRLVLGCIMIFSSKCSFSVFFKLYILSPTPFETIRNRM